MKYQIRQNKVHIEGYVNAVMRDSRPLYDKEEGRYFIERIAEKAFDRSLKNFPSVELKFNHERTIGSVAGGELELQEDDIGLFARAVVDDPEVVEKARNNELRGWSFGFYEISSKEEDIAERSYKRRTVDELHLTEVSILTKLPAYVAMSLQARDGEDGGRTLSLRDLEGIEEEKEETIPRQEEKPEQKETKQEEPKEEPVSEERNATTKEVETMDYDFEEAKLQLLKL